MCWWNGFSRGVTQLHFHFIKPILPEGRHICLNIPIRVFMDSKSSYNRRASSDNSTGHIQYSQSSMFISPNNSNMTDPHSRGVLVMKSCGSWQRNHSSPSLYVRKSPFPICLLTSHCLLLEANSVKHSSVSFHKYIIPVQANIYISYLFFLIMDIIY